jgi:hypothetical protein
VGEHGDDDNDELFGVVLFLDILLLFKLLSEQPGNDNNVDCFCCCCCCCPLDNVFVSVVVPFVVDVDDDFIKL